MNKQIIGIPQQLTISDLSAKMNERKKERKKTASFDEIQFVNFMDKLHAHLIIAFHLRIA